MRDYKGRKEHTLDGEPVRFGADFIFYCCDHTHQAVMAGIEAMYAKYEANFVAASMEKPSADGFRSGYFYSVQVPGLGAPSLQQLIRFEIFGATTFKGVPASATAGRIVLVQKG